MNFSDRLGLAMRARAVNQSVLARRLNTSQSTVSRWFSGVTPHPSTIDRIASALSVSVSWLSAGIGEGPAIDSDPPYQPQGGEIDSSELSGPAEDSILDNWNRMELIKLARLLATTELPRKELLLKVLGTLDVPSDV
jgi:transcriptional regulator with XRE-family HTH domain